VPAFSDSEMGLDTALNNRLRESTGRHKIRYDPFEDLEHFAATLLRQKKLGILTIGGGVPRNWSQQFGPFCELRHRRLGENVALKRYHYGLRICPEPVFWEVCRAALIARRCRGASSCLHRRAAGLGKCLSMRRLDCP